MYLLRSTTDGGRQIACTMSPHRALGLCREMDAKGLAPTVALFSGRELARAELKNTADATPPDPAAPRGLLLHRVVAVRDGAKLGDLYVAAESESDAVSVGRWKLCEALQLNLFDAVLSFEAERVESV